MGTQGCAVPPALLCPACSRLVSRPHSCTSASGPSLTPIFSRRASFAQNSLLQMPKAMTLRSLASRPALSHVIGPSGLLAVVALRGPSPAQSSLSQEGARLPVVGTHVSGLPCPSPPEYFTQHPPGSGAVAPALPGEWPRPSRPSAPRLTPSLSPRGPWRSRLTSLNLRLRICKTGSKSVTSEEL